jgi:Periplasmic glycine betaine/choline-binding (lipo)protein of an ABC-type transport system (osmoprotectant binding protein)
MRRLFGGVVIALTAVLALAGCGGGGANPLAEPTSEASAVPSGTTVVVGSANFPENVLLGSIYSQALQAKGVRVEEKFNIGSREIIYGQIQSGALTVLPEYIGSLLAYVDKNSTERTKDEIVAALRQKLPSTLEILEPAAAEDNNSLTVTKETAEKYGLKTIEDLAKVSKDFVVGGPPEFRQRQEENFKKTYGLEFKEWKPTGDATADAIKSGTVQVGNVFTTDPVIQIEGLVPLEDNKNAFGAENIVPLVNRDGADEIVRGTLNAVSAKLDTPTLLGLMKRVAVDKDDPATVAKDWLTQNGLV